MLAPLPAFAQVAGGGTAEGDNTPIDEIIVTSERREQSLQDVAGIAKAVTGEDLSRLNTNEFTDLSTVFPQLSIGNREGNVEVFVRGIGDDNNTELSEPRSAILLDNVYISRPRGLGSFFFDIERVELNIGPQGTLRGRNTTGGSLNIVSKRPEFGEFGGFADVSIGNFDQREFSGALNIPVSDTFALRAAGYRIEHGSFIENVSPLEIRSTQDRDDFSGRLSALWEPNDRFSALVVGDYAEHNGNGFGGIDFVSAGANGVDLDDLDDLPLDGRGRLNRGGQAFQDTQIWGLRGVFNYEVNDNLDLEYLASFRSVDFQSVGAAGDGFFGTNPILQGVDRAPIDDFFDNFALTSFDQTSESQVHEIRASGTVDKLTYAGAFSTSTRPETASSTRPPITASSSRASSSPSPRSTGRITHSTATQPMSCRTISGSAAACATRTRPSTASASARPMCRSSSTAPPSTSPSASARKA